MSFLTKLLGGREPRIVEVSPLAARFEVASGETILEAALSHNIPLPHNCTVGTCGTCKCKLIEGKVSALTDFGYALSAHEIGAGYILSCQATPKLPITRIRLDRPEATQISAETFSGRLVDFNLLTNDIAEVLVELDRPIAFLAGQHANLSALGLSRARQYSFADAPGTDVRQLRFLIRKVPGGTFTTMLFSGELKSAELQVKGPFGSFHLPLSDRPMICIAGGSGLAPILSILHDALRRNITRRCALLFGARTQSDLYLLEEIASIQERWGEAFQFMPVLSHEPADSSWKGARGLVTQFTADAMSVEDLRRAQGFMCGPPGMIDAGIAAMVELGISLDDIYYDKFTDESHMARMP